eukprot:m.1037402 g.1037402  ORF g.1037402 m.1037402 type:complete len:94 (-) comp24143_c0_seq9:1966-2247(-)
MTQIPPGRGVVLLLVCASSSLRFDNTPHTIHSANTELCPVALSQQQHLNFTASLAHPENTHTSSFFDISIPTICKHPTDFLATRPSCSWWRCC